MNKFFKKTAPLAALIASLGLGTAANAQMVCGQRDNIIAQLEKKYGETRRSVGFQRGRGVVEVYASVETGSWTILVTDPRGTTCLMAAGEAFELDKVAEADTPT